MFYEIRIYIIKIFSVIIINTETVAARRGKSRGVGTLKMGECGKTFRIIDDQNINK